MSFYNSTTKKQENAEFYYYIQHFEKYGFVWEHSTLEFKYSVEFFKDKSKLVRKITMGKNTRKKLFVDESRMWNMEQPIDSSIGSLLGTTRSIFLGYFWLESNAESLLRITGSSKDFRTTSIQEKSYYIREISRYLHQNKKRSDFLYFIY